jgi:hypothetical protein
LPFLVVFSVFSCFSACRDKPVILALSGFSGGCPVLPLYCVSSGLLFYLPACFRVAVCHCGALCLFRGGCFAALSPARLRVSVGCALPRFLALSVCLRVARLSRGLPGPGADLPRVGRVGQGRPGCRTSVRVS